MATKTQSLTVPAKDKIQEDCHCGCAPCDGSCCRLDCIVRPRFFCGQLLTDTDLSALLKWARDRFGLTRYRHGWGVVCGMDVRCDAQVPTGVIVTPGYAVDCCGDDIIVCEDARLDLKGACREEKDPCADLRKEYERQAGSSGSEAEGLQVVSNWAPGTAIAESALRVADIYVRYDEMPSDPSTAMGRGSCKQVSECDYSRTRESYNLSWDFGVAGGDPMRARAETWHEGYEKCLEVLTTFRIRFSQSRPAADVRRWLLQWIDEHPQYRLCLMREMICRQTDDFFTVERNLVNLIFYMVQNCRNAYLNCDCFACDDDARVPLARVWLMPENRLTAEACRIVAIDPYPPYRRPMQPECWPAPLDSVNVGRFIWHRWEEVCLGVDELGLNVKEQAFTLPATLTELERALQCNLFVKCDQPRVALVYDADLFGRRVIGFCETAPAPAPPKAISLAVKKHALNPATRQEVTEVKPGELVLYSIEVANNGDVDLTVDVNDDRFGNLGSKIVIGAKRRQTFEKDFHVPQDQTTAINNTVTVKGITADGQTANAEDRHTLNVVAEPLCPKIILTAPTKVEVGAAIAVSAIVQGGDSRVNPTFNWSVSAGTISSGQGTTEITIDTANVQADSVTSTLEVGGYDHSCDATRSGTTNLRRPATASKIDEYGVLYEPVEKNRLALFGKNSLNADPAALGYIFGYGVSTGEGQKRADFARDSLVNDVGIDASRLKASEGPPQQMAKTELWLVPSGATPPKPGQAAMINSNETLTDIDMIGPSRAAKLRNAGINNFSDLAAARPEDLKPLFSGVKEGVLKGWIAEAKRRTRQ